VRLANNEIGVVWKRNPEASNAPVVAVLIKGGMNMEPVRRESGHDSYRIAGVVSREGCRLSLNFEQLWGQRNP